jgi:hypothetical protein
MTRNAGGRNAWVAVGLFVIAAMANEHEVIALRQLLESTDELAANLPDPK